MYGYIQANTNVAGVRAQVVREFLRTIASQISNKV